MQIHYLNEHRHCENYITNNNTLGFRHLVFQKGEIIPSVDKENNHLLLLIKGEIKILCNEYSRILKAGELILIPKSAETSIFIQENADMVIHSFTYCSNMCDHFAFEKLTTYANKITYNFEPTKIVQPIYKFLELLIFYLDNKLLCKHIQDIKQTEMFMIFRAFYTKEECAALFYPLLSVNIDFKYMVLDNFQKVKTVQELADICCLSLTTFNRKFKVFFKDSPYNWILKQKGKHILMKLRQSNIPICDIIEEYGFSSPGHFTSYCKTHFNMTPTQLRTKLSADK